jgi:hypothetical protein
MVLGSDPYRYERVEGWFRLPEYFQLEQKHRMSPPCVACDSRDRVYIFSGSRHPLIILDKNGSFVSCWGEGHFTNPHGVFIGPDDSVFLVDRQAHVVEKFSSDGELLMTMGQRGWASPTGGGMPFNMPTHVLVAPAGEVFVSDGYGNSRIHKFSSEGELIKSWGEAGTGPGQFNVPHCTVIDGRGTLYVLDRNNHRIQLFSEDGEFIDMWTDFRYPEAAYLDREEEILYIVEGLPGPENRPRITIRDLKGKILSEWGGRESQGKGVMDAPHGLWVDSESSIYVAEGEPGLRCIHKFAKV